MEYRDIAAAAKQIGIWCFPTAGKRPLVVWKPFQSCAPSDVMNNSWARRWPWAAGGTPTGPHTNLLVVDTDSREAADWYLKGGDAHTSALSGFEHNTGAAGSSLTSEPTSSSQTDTYTSSSSTYRSTGGSPPTWCARTPRGFHFYYTWPAGLNIRNSASKVGPGIDVRGEGGFVVTPGSTRFVLREQRWEQFEYRWCKGYSPTDLPRASAPDWLCAELTKKPETSAYHLPSQPFAGRVSVTAREVFDEGVNRLLAARNGTRNETLLQVAVCFGGFIRTGRMNKGEVINSVLAVVCEWEGEPIAKSRDTLMRGIEYGKKHD